MRISCRAPGTREAQGAQPAAQAADSLQSCRTRVNTEAAVAGSVHRSSASRMHHCCSCSGVWSRSQLQTAQRQPGTSKSRVTISG